MTRSPRMPDPAPAEENDKAAARRRRRRISATSSSASGREQYQPGHAQLGRATRTAARSGTFALSRLRSPASASPTARRQRGRELSSRRMSTAPHFAIDPQEFWRDPYPALAQMRREAPICFVPQLGSTLLTRRDDIFVSEKRIDVFSSHQPAGLMIRLMGHNMMRKDGDAHMAERSIFFPGGVAARPCARTGATNSRRMRIAFSTGSAGQGARICWPTSRCRCRANASSRSPGSPTSAIRRWMRGRRR